MSSNNVFSNTEGTMMSQTTAYTTLNYCGADAPQPAQFLESMSLLEFALWYASMGWRVYPCRGKIPAIVAWNTVASTDRQFILDHWSIHPSANIGSVMGEGSGIFVLDVDLPEGPSALEILEGQHGALPLTWVQRSASGGRHYFFRYPEGGSIRTSIKTLAPGLDILSDNHGIILAPSRLRTGETYAWLQRDGEIAEAPEWLLNMIENLRPTATQPGWSTEYRIATESSPYGFVACAQECRCVAGTAKGGRNNQLNKSAFKLGQLVGGGELVEQEAENHLRAAARECGLTDVEAFGTINSGLQAGKKHPRSSSEEHKTAQGQVTVQIVEGKLPEMTDACEDLLLRDDIPLANKVFQRGPSLVTVCKLPVHKPGGGLDHESGMAVVQELTRHRCLDILGRLAIFEKFNAGKKTKCRKDVPEKIADMLLARKGGWKLPVLKGVLECPTLRPDGSIIEDAGYDVDTGYLLVKPLPVFLHEEPSRDEAIAALAFLQELLSGFCFKDRVDASVALALILTTVAKPAAGISPLFAVTAPVRGSGKSTLVDIASVISTGRACSVIAATQDSIEFEKRLVSVILSGHAVASIDNINGVLSSSLLCQAVTAECVTVRPLGSSDSKEVPNSTLWVANGNNLYIADDLTRRALMCRLDPGLERPEERSFAFNPIERAKRQRSLYVTAALTVLKAYIAAGKPDMGLTPFGSFADWSALIRSALVWAGASDPCESRMHIIENDPSTQNLSAFLECLQQTFGQRTFTSKEVVQEAGRREGELAAALEEIASEWGDPKNSQKLGFWMKKNMGRLADGRKLVKATGTSNKTAVAHWQVDCASCSASHESPLRD